MKTFKLPAIPEIAAALSVLQDRALVREIFRQKLGEQYSPWVARKLVQEAQRFGANRDAHLREAHQIYMDDLLVMGLLWVAKNPTRDPRAVLGEMPVSLPLNVPTTIDAPEAGSRFFILAMLPEEYALFHARAKQIKSLSSRVQTARVRAFVKAFPGATDKDGERWCTMPPYMIALEYVMLRHGVRQVGLESVRKWLDLAKDAGRMIEAAITDLERRQGPLPWLRAAWRLPAAPKDSGAEAQHARESPAIERP